MTFWMILAGLLDGIQVLRMYLGVKFRRENEDGWCPVAPCSIYPRL